MLEPVVFLPGLLCDAAFWRAPIDALADRVAPMVADLTLDASIPGMARRTLAAAPPRFSLVGLSMGGYVAFEILRQAPERVVRLALSSTSAAPDTPERAAERRAGIASAQHAGAERFRGITDRLLPRLVHPSHLVGPVAEAVKDMGVRVGAQAFIRQQTAILGRVDSRPGLAAVRVPTLLMVGADDQLTPPAEMQQIKEGIAGAVLHVLPDCGHLPPLEQPDDTARLLRKWLALG